ncbi:MAG: histidinol-phosphate transaminase [Anaerolineae bacterium]
MSAETARPAPVTAADVSALVRRDIVQMQPYTPILPFEVLSEQLDRPADQIIKLDANENPYGPSPRALAALREIGARIPIYPDPESRALRAALARYLGIDMAHILIGAGADELIDLIIRLVIRPGDTIIDCPPTFGMYAFDAALSGGQVVAVPRRPDFSLDLPSIERAARGSQARLLFLASPNNPDGGLLPAADLDRLLKLPLIVVLDEAYIDFSGAESAISRVPQAPNLIVLRTFSKWAGLAGLRVGWGVFPLPLMEHLWKIKQPYNLNVAADAAARASLEDVETLQASAARIAAERDRLIEALDAVPYLEPYPSRGNFVLCRVIGMDAQGLKARLAAEFGILVRHFNKPGLDDHIRITAGRPEHTDALLAALHAIQERG